MVKFLRDAGITFHHVVPSSRRRRAVQGMLRVLELAGAAVAGS